MPQKSEILRTRPDTRSDLQQAPILSCSSWIYRPSADQLTKQCEIHGSSCTQPLNRSWSHLPHWNRPFMYTCVPNLSLLSSGTPWLDLPEFKHLTQQKDPHNLWKKIRTTRAKDAQVRCVYVAKFGKNSVNFPPFWATFPHPCTDGTIFGRLLHANHTHRYSVSPLHGEKPQNRFPMADLNTGCVRFAALRGTGDWERVDQSCPWVGLTHRLGWVGSRFFSFWLVVFGWVHYSKSTKRLR